jgi:hypothetical protein
MEFNIENENQLKEVIRQSFSDDFIIQEAPEGLFHFEGESRKVFPDFILNAKPELIHNFGFPEGFFIIETKFLSSDSVPDLSNLYIQCLTYKQTTFNGLYPFAVFHFTNINYILDPPTPASRMNEVLLCTFGRINIGRISISHKNYEFLLHKGDILFRKKYNEYKQFRKDLLKISFGSGNNKLIKTY